MHPSPQPEQQGFTLIELLISMALALVIIGFLSSSFIFQRKTYAVQEQIAEMNQNARAAMDIMSRDIMMTGYGIAKSNYANLSSWVDWGSVTFGSDPFVIEPGAGDLSSDIIHVAGCFDGAAATLSSDVTAGATTIDVTPVDAGDTVADLFDTVDEKVICINELENAVVTGVSGNTLTIDTDPGTAGDQGLANDYTASATTIEICVVKIISYSIVQDPDGSYILKRDGNLGAGRQPLAENIVQLGITRSGNTIEINPLTAQTDKPDPDYTDNSGYRRCSLRSYITPPNLGF
jgi:prepilin-type N-terminal cleavage/methylation domain-containing protein